MRRSPLTLKVFLLFLVAPFVKLESSCGVPVLPSIFEPFFLSPIRPLCLTAVDFRRHCLSLLAL